MKRILALAVFLVVVKVASAQNVYQIDPTHSSARFGVKHMMVSEVQGEFQKLSGNVSFDPQKPALSKIDATIDVASLSTRDERRDGDLKSPNFFDVAKFPTMTYQSVRVEKKGNKYIAFGNLTLHGVTKPVTLTIDAPSSEVKDPLAMDPYGMMRFGAHATTQINRKDFGMSFNQLLDNGGAAVGDVVTINLDIEMVRKPTQLAVVSIQTTSTESANRRLDL